jgi:hypothetical protein
MADFDNEYPGLYYEEVSGQYDDQIPPYEPMSKIKFDRTDSTPVQETPEEEIPDSVTLDIEEILYETDKAWLIVTTAGEAWFPKSKCNLDREHDAVTLPQWLYDRKF